VSRRRALSRAFWRVVNPLTRWAAGLLPWWVLIETTGCKTGRRRRTPLATGPRDSEEMLLMSAHGRQAGWVRNIAADPRVRLRHHGRWRPATATIEPLTDDLVRRFNRYARLGGRLMGIDPVLVRIRYGPAARASG
jgi:deazaflavin-dependent oxidoreductase (nitroreductase family)